MFTGYHFVLIRNPGHDGLVPPARSPRTLEVDVSGPFAAATWWERAPTWRPPQYDTFPYYPPTGNGPPRTTDYPLRKSPQSGGANDPLQLPTYPGMQPATPGTSGPKKLLEALGDAYQNLGVLHLVLRNEPAEARKFFDKSFEVGPRPRVGREWIAQIALPACDRAAAGQPIDPVDLDPRITFLE